MDVEKNTSYAQKWSYFISLKFAPGLKKEFLAIGENLRKKGFNVNYLISDNYSNIEGDVRNINYICTKDGLKNLFIDSFKLSLRKNLLKIFKSSPPNFCCFYNTHPLNPSIAKLIKKEFPDAILSLYLHDPYKPDIAPYGIKKGLYIRIGEFIQGKTIKYMDYIISPSAYSSYLFKKKYPTYNGENNIAPLFVPDNNSNSKNERIFFSIVGGAHSATGHDVFINLVNYVAEKGLNYKFALISSSNLNGLLRQLTDKGKGILQLINKKIIKDNEIYEIVRKSFAVFRFDREVTQSGVIPVVFMNETPIIARDIKGLRQHIKHKHNGYIIPFDSSMEDTIEAMDYIKDNFAELSINARKSYEETWADWNFDKYYGWLLERLK